MDIRRQVGLTVQRYRRARGLSQEGLAFEADIHRTYVSGVERGVRNITLTVVAKFAAALQVLPHQLLEPPPGEGAVGRGLATEPSSSHPAGRSGRARAAAGSGARVDRRPKVSKRD